MSILSIGQIVFDILAYPISENLFSTDTLVMDSIEYSNGGDALNVAMICKKLSNSVDFIGRVGNDHFGSFLIEKMKQQGLSTNGVVLDQQTPTSSVLVLIQKNGLRNFLYYGGANNNFSLDDIDWEIVNLSDIVYIGGTFLLPQFDGVGAAQLLSNSKSLGKTTCMDVTYDPSGRWLDIIRPCLPFLDYFLPSINEARAITGKDDVREMAEFLMSYGVKNIIIKMGSEGVYVRNITHACQIPPYDVPVVDTTGAGDSFVAGFITGINQGLGLLKSVDLGQAVSAKCIQEIGSTTGDISLNSIEQFLKEQTRS